MPRFLRQIIADDFEQPQAVAGRPVVTAGEAQQMWDNGFLARRNTRGDASTRLLIGETTGGRRVTLVSRAIDDGDWLTFTAWETKASDLA